MGKDVSCSHLKVFRHEAFEHVPKEHWQKLYDKASPCIFGSYGDAKFGYRIWNPERKKIIRSRDVAFHKIHNRTNFKKSESTKHVVEDVSNLIHVSLSTDGTTLEGKTQVDRYAANPVWLRKIM